MVKENHGEFKEAIEVAMKPAAQRRAADVVEVNKGHGRLEKRRYWWVEVDEALRDYLAKEYGWPDVRWCGLGQRTWRHLYEDTWHEAERLWVLSARHPLPLTPAQLSQWARNHWQVENRTFWVLDVTYQEDRNHARRVGPMLHLLRLMAINVIRQQGFRYVPDGRRTAAALPDRGLDWLFAP